MKKFMLFCGSVIGSVVAFAEGSTPVLETDPVPGWIDLIQERLSSWVSEFAPLFVVGFSLLLMYVGLKLIKRTTNRAT